MKIFLIATKSESVLTFRKGLIGELKRNGHSVGIIAHDKKREKDIVALGAKFYCVEQDNRGINPFAILQYQNKIKQILKMESPDFVFTFQLKPNTFGVFAAKATGIEKIFCMVEGVGDVFINQSIKWKTIRAVVCSLYQRAFKNAQKIFFLNNDDKEEFVARGLVPEEKSEVIPGVGVDLEHFAGKPLQSNNTFLMIARMLKTKGVFEYCACARAVKEKYPDVQFNYLGEEGTVKLADIQEYITDGSVNYLGTTRDVRPYLDDCTMLILPSYREGLSMSIMEAEAVGRGIITTDTAGCRDAVADGYNGYLVPVRDYEAIAQKCFDIIEHPDEAVRLGANSRSFAETHFDQRKINEKLVAIIQSV